MSADQGKFRDNNENSALDAPDPRRWKILFVLVATLFMTHVSISNINVTLPSLQHGFGATNSELQWILSGYTLTFGMMLIPAGRAGDFFGRKYLFISGVSIFVLASIWAIFAPNATVLIIARMLQGIGSGLLTPQGLGFIQYFFKGEERPRAFAAFGATVGISVAIGPLIGGLIVEAVGIQNGWRATIALNIPLGLLAIALALAWMPKPGEVKRNRSRNFKKNLSELDAVGALLTGSWVFAIMFPFMESGKSPLFWLSVPIGVLIFIAWVIWERQLMNRGRTPMVNLAMLKISSYRNGVIIGSFFFLGFTTVWVLVTLYMQEGLGHSAFNAGLVGLPGAIASSVVATLAGRQVIKHGRRVVIFGIYLAITGMIASVIVVLLREAGLVSEWWLLLTLALIGASQGAVISPNNAITLSDVIPTESGSLGAVLQTGQRVGTSVGISVVTAVAFAVLATHGWAIAFSVGFAMMLVVLLFVLFFAYRDLYSGQSVKF